MNPNEIVTKAFVANELFSIDPGSSNGGIVKWNENRYESWALSKIKASMPLEISKAFKVPEAHIQNVVCKHTRIEEIQGGQIERCLDCGKTWG